MERAILWGSCGAALGGAVAAWAAALTICAPEDQYWKDAESGVEMLITRKHTLLGLPASLWASLTTLLALVVVPVMMSLSTRMQVSTVSSAPSYTAGQQLLADIEAGISSRSSARASGNNATAKAVATSVSQALEQATQAAITAGNATAPRQKAIYNVYAHLTEHQLHLLIYAPEMKELGEAGRSVLQRTMQSLSIQSANQVLKAYPAKLTVAAKGLLFWEFVFQASRAAAEAGWQPLPTPEVGGLRPRPKLEAALTEASGDSSY